MQTKIFQKHTKVKRKEKAGVHYALCKRMALSPHLLSKLKEKCHDND